MIELAPESCEWLTYNEAILYCQFCDHNEHLDWRMPTAEEYRYYSITYGWYVNTESIRRAYHSAATRRVTPVRDI